MSLRSLVYVSRVCLCTQVREAEPDPKKKTFSPIVVEARVVSVICFFAILLFRTFLFAIFFFCRAFFAMLVGCHVFVVSYFETDFFYFFKFLNFILSGVTRLRDY